MGTLGTFKVTGGKLLVTDPCYDIGTWCQGVLKNVKNGTWEAETDIVSGRVGTLRITAVGETPSGPWFDQDFDVGVDSGQAGFFTYAKFPKGDRDSCGGSYGRDKFYDQCCEATIGGKGGIVEGTGAVSQSGWGDGGYLCRTRRNKDDKLVQAEIVFINEDEADLKECKDCGERFAEFDMDGGRCNPCANARFDLDGETGEEV